MRKEIGPTKAIDINYISYEILVKSLNLSVFFPISKRDREMIIPDPLLDIFLVRIKHSIRHMKRICKL